MLELKEKCIHPVTGKPYIVSSVGGKECSVEGIADGITHAFVVGFASVADRDYYAKKDPAHLDFGASLTPIVQKVHVVDIEHGVY
ncbi:stress responsive A/B barrel domain protein [Penicillium odoratum]|uniref:stress responsive A/B barrel domain protein n=1 Tax=Penicillium odoratum TaxID=1167516 RepID=UPI0025473D1D|nr:stress responsive A/B barrel domain protein [Penicillium odoratum]KAJ5764751.1 stress responsive A/B barrel domain protein [Penicillium odoratum]